MRSLLDMAAPVFSKQVATLRLEALRSELSETLSNPRHYPAKVKTLVADIAAMRVVVGPPIYIPRAFDNALKPRSGTLLATLPSTHAKPVWGGHFVAHDGKRQ